MLVVSVDGAPGVHAIGNLMNGEPGDVEIGQRVRAVFEDVAAMGRAREPGVARAAVRGHNHTGVEEQVGRIDCSVEYPARVIAQIENQSVEHAFVRVLHGVNGAA